MEKAVKEKGLYGRMMKSIRTSHSIGNTVRMIKLPLIFTDARLYGGAIANFYWLTATLERCLEQAAAKEPHGLVSEFRALLPPLSATAGYEADLADLFGAKWQQEATKARTAATAAYCAILETATQEELVGAAFILYGALVVGGGKATQRKVRKIFPACQHKLFDLSDDIVELRRRFKESFSQLGKSHPDLEDALVNQAARFMALNNTVVLSIRCLPSWWWPAVSASVALGTALVISLRRRYFQLQGS